ncbi:MAG: hypothetical protein QG604_401 [Candidatus Dependentiae bacterium]|nr:hypothetical protein [Candidatus Dependentiae bacterium]
MKRISFVLMSGIAVTWLPVSAVGVLEVLQSPTTRVVAGVSTAGLVVACFIARNRMQRAAILCRSGAMTTESYQKSRALFVAACKAAAVVGGISIATLMSLLFKGKPNESALLNITLDTGNPVPLRKEAEEPKQPSVADIQNVFKQIDFNYDEQISAACEQLLEEKNTGMFMAVAKKAHESGKALDAITVNYGKKPLLFAAAESVDAVMFNSLVKDYGMSCVQRDIYGCTVLSHAIFYANIPLAKELIKEGLLPIDAVDTYGYNALHLAVAESHELVSLLLDAARKRLDHDAFVAWLNQPATTHGNPTPLEFAVLSDSMDALAIVKALVEAGAGVTPKIVGCADKNLARVDLLISHGADKKLPDELKKVVKYLSTVQRTTSRR